MNSVHMIGRLGRDPELKVTQSGTEVANWSLAVQRDFKNGAGERETDWIPCVAWRGTAKFVAEYARSGARIACKGRWQVRKYEHEGEKRTAHELVCEQVEIIDWPDKTDAGTQGATQDDGQFDPFTDE